MIFLYHLGYVQDFQKLVPNFVQGPPENQAIAARLITDTSARGPLMCRPQPEVYRWVSGVEMQRQKEVILCCLWRLLSTFLLHSRTNHG